MSQPKPYIYTDNNPNTMSDYARSILRLKRPDAPVDVVLDTDPANEVDDQFAIAYLLQHQDKLKLKGIYAAPFFNHHSEGPADGMEKSYKEVFHVLSLLNRNEYASVVYKGAAGFCGMNARPLNLTRPVIYTVWQCSIRWNSPYM